MAIAPKTLALPVWTEDHDENIRLLADYAEEAGQDIILREERNPMTEDSTQDVEDMDSDQINQIGSGDVYAYADAAHENNWDYAADNEEAQINNFFSEIWNLPLVEAAVASLSMHEARAELGLPSAAEAASAGDNEDDDGSDDESEDELTDLAEEKAEEYEEELKDGLRESLRGQHTFFELNLSYRGSLQGELSLDTMHQVSIDTDFTAVHMPFFAQSRERDASAGTFILLGAGIGATRFAMQCVAQCAVCALFQPDRENSDYFKGLLKDLAAAAAKNPAAIQPALDQAWADAGRAFAERLAESENDEERESIVDSVADALANARATFDDRAGFGLPAKAWTSIFGENLPDSALPTKNTSSLQKERNDYTLAELDAEWPAPFFSLDASGAVAIAQSSAATTAALDVANVLDRRFAEAMGTSGMSLPADSLQGVATALEFVLANLAGNDLKLQFQADASDLAEIGYAVGREDGNDSLAFGFGELARHVRVEAFLNYDEYEDPAEFARVSTVVDLRECSWSKEDTLPAQTLETIEQSRFGAWHRAESARGALAHGHMPLRETMITLLNSVAAVEDPLARERLLGSTVMTYASLSASDEKTEALHALSRELDPSASDALVELRARIALRFLRDDNWSDEDASRLALVVGFGADAKSSYHPLSIPALADALGFSDAFGEALAGRAPNLKAPSKWPRETPVLPDPAILQANPTQSAQARLDAFRALGGAATAHPDPLLNGAAKGSFVRALGLDSARGLSIFLAPQRLAQMAREADAAGALAERLSERDPMGRTALHLAVDSGRMPLINAILALGPDLEARDALGRTPLLTLARAHHAHNKADKNFIPAVARLFAAHGADFNAVDNEGASVVHLSRLGNETVGLMSALGANLQIRDAQGKTAADRQYWNEKTQSEIDAAALQISMETRNGPILPPKAFFQGFGTPVAEETNEPESEAEPIKPARHRSRRL